MYLYFQNSLFSSELVHRVSEISESRLLIQSKIDGCAIAIKYKDGKFESPIKK